jgi:uncharacterized membrane protein HdeD (DUF308 family)
MSMDIDKRILWLGLLSGVIALILGVAAQGDIGITILAMVATAGVVLVLYRRRRQP